MMTPEVEAYIGLIIADAGLAIDDAPPERRLAVTLRVAALRKRIMRAAAAGPGTVAGLPEWIHALKRRQDAGEDITPSIYRRLTDEEYQRLLESWGRQFEPVPPLPPELLDLDGEDESEGG